MARAEVLIEAAALGEGFQVTVERAPAEVPRDRQPLPGEPDPAVLARLVQDPLPQGAAREVGEVLYGWLRGAEGTRQLLDRLRSIAHHQPGCPLFLEFRAPEPKGLPWELLRDPENGFLALDDRWPVCRRVNPVVERELEDQVLEPPLRLAAVLSAAGVDATGEWEALRRAVAEIDPVELPVRLRVVVGQPELLERVEADLAELAAAGESAAEDGAAAHGGDACTVTTGEEVKGRLLDFRPHLLHFFCHGTPDHGGLLHLARPGDFVTRHPTGSVVLGAEAFQSLAARGEESWLVTLNACDTGRPVAGTHALTENIAHAGFPAVVGMREPVRFGDAHVFAGALYRNLLRQLVGRVREAAQEDGGDGLPRFRELDFASLLLEPRRALAERHAGGLPVAEAAAHRKEWSLPVLFVRPEPLRLAVRPPRAEPPDLEELAFLQAQLQTLVQLRAALSTVPDVPAEKLARLDREIAALTERLLAA